MRSPAELQTGLGKQDREQWAGGAKLPAVLVCYSPAGKLLTSLTQQFKKLKKYYVFAIKKQNEDWSDG